MRTVAVARQGVTPGRARRPITAGIFILCILAAGLACAESGITINGRTLQAAGGSISVTGDTIIVNGSIVAENITEGSGTPASETRMLAGFDELRLEIPADITVTRGDTARCMVTADDNILPLVLTESIDGILRISVKGSYASARMVKIDLQAPALATVVITGSGRITLADVMREALGLTISGSGNIHAGGKVNTLTARITGSGNIHAADLEAETVAVTINGSGDAAVHATASLTAEVTGSGVVRYRGTPPGVYTAVRGTGGVTGN